MRYRRLVFIVGLILAFLAWEAVRWLIWPGTQLQALSPQDRHDALVNVMSDAVYALVVGLILLFWSRIKQFLQKLWFPESRSREEKIDEAEKSYLDNVVARFRIEESWDTTQYTDLNAVFQDLELEWRYVRPLWKLPGSEALSPQTEAILGQRVRLLPFLEKKRRVMLKGDPGTGKTLTLRRYAVSAAEADVKVPRQRRRLPLYVSLREYRGRTQDGQPQPVYDFLQAYIAAEYPGAAFLREHLTEYLDKGRLILLFDGVNEMPADDYVERLDQLVQFTHRQYPRNKAIYTCRTLHYTSSTKFETITITDLDDGQVLQFLEKYLGSAEAARSVFRELASGDRFMLRLCRNPFMLRMLACRAPHRDRVPQNRSELFEEFVLDRLAIAADAESSRSDTVVPFLRELAFAMNEAGLFAGSVSEEWMQQRITADWTQDQMQLAIAAQLADRTADGRVRFYHQILQEYFAASELLRRFEAGEDVDEFLSNSLWEETIILAAGLQDQPEPVLRRLWDLENGSIQNLWLAAKAMGASGRAMTPEYRENILNQLARHLQLDEDKESIEETETIEVIEGDLKQKVKRWMWGEKREKKQDADVSGEIEEENSLDLVAAIESTKTLGYIEDPESIEFLAAAIIKHKRWVREVAIRVLGTMRSESAHSSLVQATREIANPTTLRLVWTYLEPGERLYLLYRTIPTPIVILLDAIIASVVLTFIAGFALKRFVYPQGIPDRAAQIVVGSICGSISLLSSLSILLYLLRETLNGELSIGRLVRAVQYFVRRQGLVKPAVRSLFGILALSAFMIAMHVLGPLARWLLDLGLQLLFVWALRTYCSRGKGRRAVDFVLDPSALFAAVIFFITGLILGLALETTLQDLNLQAIPSLSPFYWAHVASLVLWVLVVLGQVLIVLYFLCCYLRATIRSFQMWRLSRLAQQLGMRNTAIESLMSIAEHSLEWNRLRALAARHLRAIDLQAEQVECIRSIEATEDSLVRELERTVYEQESRLREKRRRSAVPPW